MMFMYLIARQFPNEGKNRASNLLYPSHLSLTSKSFWPYYLFVKDQGCPHLTEVRQC